MFYIKKTTGDDVDGLSVILNGLAGEGFPGLGPPPEKAEILDYLLESSSSGGVFLSLFWADGLVGWADARRVVDGVMEIEMGMVSRVRGRGLGGALLDVLLSVARGRGCGEAVLTVNPGNMAAISLYTSRGFVRERENDSSDREAMRLVLFRNAA